MDKGQNQSMQEMIKLADKMQPILKNLGVDVPMLENLMNNLKTGNGLFSLELMGRFSALQEEIRKTENLSVQEFEKKYSAERARSAELGKKGWVISQHVNPRIVKEWYKYLGGKDADNAIVKYFYDKGILEKIRTELSRTYINLPDKRYYDKGINAFDDGDYMGAAMYLFPLFDKRTSELVRPEGIKNKERYGDKGYLRKREKVYEGKGFFSKEYIFINGFASLIAFTRRTFCEESGYSMRGGTEPPYLNRNWLLHGRMERTVEKYECLQLLNALGVLEYLCQ